MSESRSVSTFASRYSDRIVVAMLAMIAAPAAITLHTVRVPATLQVSSPNPTPYGYTFSLLLFIVPIIVIACWFLPNEGVKIPKCAFWRTIAILVPAGFGLDFFFAHRFFYFPNKDATLKITAPALGGPVPIEEYGFYLTGFIAILLIYTWAEEYWLAAYNVSDYPGASKRLPRLMQFHAASIVLGLALIAAAVVYKKTLSANPEGFPSYFTFLVATAVIPSAGFFHTARQFINWRAFSLTLFVFLLVSLFWEATLAVPYGWWGYQPSEMIGISIGAWSGLPIEAVFVWIAVIYATAIIFETIKLWQASGKGLRKAFWG